MLATLPKGLHPARSQRLNAQIYREGPVRGVVIADVFAHTGPPWAGKLAADEFHPNDAGYCDWAVAFAEAVDLPSPPSPPSPDAICR